MAHDQYRLMTRSDFDGLVCAALLQELGLIDDIKFVHPKDVQDGVVEITDRDILTNLPYDERCFRCFDHHDSEAARLGDRKPENLVLVCGAKSAARVVFDHYGGTTSFGHRFDEMMTAVDKADSADFIREEILTPDGWTLLSFLMDARTGLGRFRDFRISNYELMMQLIEDCRKLTIDEILQLPDVRERVDLYREHEGKMREQVERCATVHGPLVVLDLRNEEIIYAGNRFMVYALFPESNVSMHVIWGRGKVNTVFAMGKSILDRSSTVDIGSLALAHGGGGHAAAGTCQVANDDADRVQQELIDRLSAPSARQAA